jgi:hypothetical protein
LEVALFGKAEEQNYIDGLRMLERTFRLPPTSKAPARIQQILHSVYVSPVITLASGKFCAFLPGDYAGCFDSQEQALASLKPALMAIEKDQTPPPSILAPIAREISGLKYAEKALMSLFLGRFDSPASSGKRICSGFSYFFNFLCKRRPFESGRFRSARSEESPSN